jgi:HAMP domain-containing protein
MELGEIGFDRAPRGRCLTPRLSSVGVRDGCGYHPPDHRGWRARIDLSLLDAVLGEVKLGSGGDVVLVGQPGPLRTEPRRAPRPMVGTVAMQVPTRQAGPVTVDRRTSYAGRSVYHSKLHMDELGCWLVYEEDYQIAMAPVIDAQRQIWISVLVVGAIAILAALRIAQSILRPVRGLALGARRINEGLVGVKIPRGGRDEIGMMIDTFNEMAMKITLSQAELQYKNKMLNAKNDELQEKTRSSRSCR